jgi:hypothetical protein
MRIQQEEGRWSSAQKRDDLSPYVQAGVVVDVLIRSIKAMTHENDRSRNRALGVHHGGRDEEVDPGRKRCAALITLEAESTPQGVSNALT